jgi:hypothetical protein
MGIRAHLAPLSTPALQRFCKLSAFQYGLALGRPFFPEAPLWPRPRACYCAGGAGHPEKLSRPLPRPPLVRCGLVNDPEVRRRSGEGDRSEIERGRFGGAGRRSYRHISPEGCRAGPGTLCTASSGLRDRTGPRCLCRLLDDSAQIIRDLGRHRIKSLLSFSDISQRRSILK